MIIIPDNYKTIRIPYTYLHGKLEKDVGYDCYELALKEELFQLNENDRVIVDPKNNGMYQLFFNTKACTMFLWTIDGTPKQRGLVVYNEDIKSYTYALECYLNEEVVL